MEFTTLALAPITDAISNGFSTMVPIGLGVMGTFVGISILKRVVYTFL
jgi:hypothetical protein